jgi:hypothetical protein
MLRLRKYTCKKRELMYPLTCFFFLSLHHSPLNCVCNSKIVQEGLRTELEQCNDPELESIIMGKYKARLLEITGRFEKAQAEFEKHSNAAAATVCNDKRLSKFPDPSFLSVFDLSLFDSLICLLALQDVTGVEKVFRLFQDCDFRELVSVPESEEFIDIFGCSMVQGDSKIKFGASARPQNSCIIH